MTLRQSLQRAWSWLARTFAGRVLLLAIALKVIARMARLATSLATLRQGVDTVGSLLLIVVAAVIGYRAYLHVKRVVLWRVRRKLMLSYVFIGFVPALLLIVFFTISGLLLFFNVGGYMLRSRLAAAVDHAQAVAETTAADLSHVPDPQQGAATIARQQQRANRTLPLVSLALLPSSAACSGGDASGGSGPLATAGPWAHTSAPRTVPEWVSCAGYAGVVAGDSSAGAGGRPWVAARAVAWMDRGGARQAVVVDVPIGDAFLDQVATETGVSVQTLLLFNELSGSRDEREAASAAVSRAGGTSGPAIVPRRGSQGPANISLQGGSLSPLRWAALLDYTDWGSGRKDALFVQFGLGLRAVYERIAPVTRLGDLSFAQVLVVIMAVVAVLFLIILAVAFLVGVVLARSITGAVHELFEGTERVRGGDFSHKIVVRSRDQLGELAESFNSMTASIADLLQQKAQKERLEQELRIARGIQMSLLPQEPLTAVGVSFAGHCEPAREVGGDYYDFWAIDEHRYGMLIADVAGKGTSAALYMAELKGIVLSFSQSHDSPRKLLIDANRIMSHHLDSRRFITMTYGVVDTRARTLTYARAGHCPLIRLPGPGAPSRAAEILAPDGLVLGLKLDDGTFERLLEEATLVIAPGDAFLLYTDGLTEAMNPAGDFFGEERLSALVQSHGTAPFHELRDEILRAVSSFVGPAEQQDDMTMLLLRVQTMEQAAA